MWKIGPHHFKFLSFPPNKPIGDWHNTYLQWDAMHLADFPGLSCINIKVGIRWNRVRTSLHPIWGPG